MTRFHITPFDIRHGLAMDCFKCPIARAVTRRLKPTYRASVASTSILILNENNKVVFAISAPKIALDFMHDFDYAMLVDLPDPDRPQPKPFMFKADIPKRYLRYPKKARAA